MAFDFDDFVQNIEVSKSVRGSANDSDALDVEEGAEAAAYPENVSSQVTVRAETGTDTSLHYRLVWRVRI